MDAKDLRIETALSAHTNDGSTKYAQSGTALHSNGIKPYHDIGTNSLAKVDVPTSRPCAVIGPDRILPQQSTSDLYLKKIPVEPWPCTDIIYQHPPEYPHKSADYLPPRNISPRQTFQENMQRIMVPPTYASLKSNEDRALKSSKVPSEAKYCDVPYTISPINNEPKIAKSSEGLVLNNNPTYTQHLAPNNWPGSGVNVRPLRSYGAPELYQYSEHPNYPGSRPISMIRPHRNVHEDVPQVYQDRFYPEANLRFKPYPTAKERPHQFTQARYDYIANYPNAFHLHNPYTPHKYDLQKSMPPHPCPVYPPVSLKYLDRRIPAANMERYQRSPTQQVHYNPPFCNQNIPSNYGSVPGNCLTNRLYPYTPEPPTKPMIQNRLYFDGHSNRKYFPNSENMYLNDMNQLQAMKNDLLYQTYQPSINIQSLSPHHVYRKENPMKGYEQANHFRNIEYSANMNPLSRLPLQFSPQTISISPDSNTSNDTTQIVYNAQEDCGYVSQSSTASVKSMESGINRISSDVYRRHDIRNETISRTNQPGQKLDINTSSKDKKALNVRQFLQMWNEGDEGYDNNKETFAKKDSCDPTGNNQINDGDAGKNQEQLYVLGLVNVPNEELCKYDHIQKISKLPENIKGYNNIEILNQYEKLIESPGVNNFSLTQQTKQKDLHTSVRNMPRQGFEVQPRPISPLDVEAKISQSVIHKEVGCNFEIRPCSPQMLNVEVATPVHNVLGERIIEKVVNPNMVKSPMLHRLDESNNDTLRNSPKVQSCKLVNNQYISPISDSLKTNYCLQDLESNSGICLASLPRLDNDIELNFPEINQQFINANKIDSTKSSPSIQDLPILETEVHGNVHKIRNKLFSKPFIAEQHNSGCESDKEVSKLSKYRKHKKNTPTVEVNESDVNSTQSLNRTDSVIIKNPENTKSPVEYLNIPLNNNKSCNGNTKNDSNGNNMSICINSNKDINETISGQIKCYISTDSDTAIDFSLNKNDDQGNYTNSMNNLTDSVQYKINTSQNILRENHSNESNACKTDLPEQLTKSSASTEFSISQPNSPILGNFSCSGTLKSNNNIVTDEAYGLKEMNTFSIPMLDDKIDFKSFDEVNLINKTEITLSNSDKLVTDTSSVSELVPKEIIPKINLPISCPDIESTSKNIKCYKQINTSGFDEKFDFKSNDEDTLIDKDITHPNSDEINIDTSSVTALITDENIPQNNLRISCPDIENTSKDMVSYKLINTRRMDERKDFRSLDKDTLTEVTNFNTEEMVTDTSSVSALVTEDLFPQINKGISYPDTENTAENLKTYEQINTNGIYEKVDFKSNYKETVINKTDVIHTNSEENFKDTSSVSALGAEEINVRISCPDTESTAKIMKSNEQTNMGDELFEKVDFKSSYDEIVMNKTDVTHSNSKEILTDTLQITVSASESKNIMPQNNLPTSCYDKDLKNINTCDSISITSPVLSNDVENQVLVDYMAEKHELYKPNLLKVNDTHQKSLNKSNIEIESNNSTVDVMQENIVSYDANESLHLVNENENIDDNSILDFVSKETQKVTSMAEVNPKKETDMSTTACKVKTLSLRIDINEDSHFVNSKNDHNGEFTMKPSSGNDVKRNFINISEDNIADNITEDNISNTKDCFKKFMEHSSKSGKEVNSFISSNIDALHLNIENKSKCDTINSLRLNEYNSTKIKGDALSEKFYETKNDYVFKKELFSPWVQKLLTNNDGIISSSKILEDKLLKKMDNNYSYDNNYNESLVNKNTLKRLVTPLVENNFSYQEPKVIAKIDIRDRNEREYQTKCETKLVSNEENKHSELQDSKIDNVAISVDEIIFDNINETSYIVENNVTEPFSFELEEHHTDEFQSPNSLDINGKLNKNLIEIQTVTDKLLVNQSNIRSRTLKRSLSESAVTDYTAAANSYKDIYENNLMYGNKRTKVDNSEIIVESGMIAENFTSFIQNNRRNSISTIYNDENVSFCIVIDNDYVLGEENDTSQKNCYTEIPSECLATICSEADALNSELTEVITSKGSEQCSNELILQNVDNKSIEESWIDDVACMETVFSDDIAEDIVISAPSSPKSTSSSEDGIDNFDSVYNVNENEHANKVKYIYGNQMCDDDAQLVEKLYRTPQMNVNKTLIDSESQHTDEYNRYYDTESLEKILSESTTAHDMFSSAENHSVPDICLALPNSNDLHETIENFKTPLEQETTMNLSKLGQVKLTNSEETKKCNDGLVHSCESSSDHFINNRKEENVHYAISSSPEVSSTTPEDKSSSILLKIRSYKGTKISEINDMGSSFTKTHSLRGTNSNYNSCTTRPLITKAAQKYIPPLKETMRDLKVKLHLPKQSLYKLQQLKKSKEEPKIYASGNKHYIRNLQHENPKKAKPKPKFEDVLKSIDEIQFKMHKEKHKKAKQSVPKVIIKKNENGAHYASTQTKDTFNPDLTGRKWQPWVFLEKSNFIDKMALKQKFKAIYNHRKKTYVLAENFRKYKSISNSKFVMSHPNSNDNNLSSGKLKYTFRLKHN